MAYFFRLLYCYILYCGVLLISQCHDYSCLVCLFTGECLWLLWDYGPQLLVHSSALPPLPRRPSTVSDAADLKTKFSIKSVYEAERQLICQTHPNIKSDVICPQSEYCVTCAILSVFLSGIKIQFTCRWGVIVDFGNDHVEKLIKYWVISCFVSSFLIFLGEYVTHTQTLTFRDGRFVFTNILIIHPAKMYVF